MDLQNIGTYEDHTVVSNGEIFCQQRLSFLSKYKSLLLVEYLLQYMSPLWLILLVCKLLLIACFSALRAAFLCCRYLQQDVHSINIVNRTNKPPPNEIYNVGMLNCKQFISFSSKPEGQCWTLSHQTVELMHAFSSGHLKRKKPQNNETKKINRLYTSTYVRFTILRYQRMHTIHLPTRTGKSYMNRNYKLG